MSKRVTTIAGRKLLRILKLIQLLQTQRMSLGQIATYLEVNERTVYRYLQTFEEAGYVVDKDFNNRFFIAT